MKLKLKEEPREWLKFTAVMSVLVMAVAWLLHRRKLIGLDVIIGVVAALMLILLTCAARPRWFRGLYRTGMTVSFHIGQVIGRVVLTVFFLIVVTPLGLLLRLLGKDLLELKRRDTSSYWRTSKSSSRFDQQF